VCGRGEKGDEIVSYLIAEVQKHEKRVSELER